MENFVKIVKKIAAVAKVESFKVPVHLSYIFSCTFSCCKLCISLLHLAVTATDTTCFPRC